MQTRAVVSASDAMIRHLKLQITKLRREQFGHGAERHEADLRQDGAKTDAAAAKTTVAAFRTSSSGPQAVP